MPVYEYKCNICDNIEVEERGMMDESKVPALCQQEGCSGISVKQFGFAPSFKGDGFYTNDKRKPVGE
jgi:putative FmdB family regulatory protein